MKNVILYYVLGLLSMLLSQSVKAQGTIAEPVKLGLLLNETKDITRNTVYDLSKNKQIIHFTFSINKPSTVIIRHRKPMNDLPSEILLNFSIYSGDNDGYAYLIKELGVGEHCFTSYFKDGSQGLITTTIQVYEKGNPGVANLSQNKNYILNRTYTQENSAYYLDQILYMDGLGRLEQTVQRGITPMSKDLIMLLEYDEFARKAAVWLPGLSSSNGGYSNSEAIKASAKSESMNNNPCPYSMSIYENSPMNRTLEQYGPGQEWHNKGKSLKTTYKINTQKEASLNCILYRAEGTNSAPTLRKDNFYANGQLYVNEIRDEDGNASYEFEDIFGKVVLTRQMNNGVKLDTYYVYNDFGNLCFVLPPRINEEGITQNKLDELAYLYKYDSKNRCIAKKCPGAEWIYFVYDQTDRLIFTQDGNMRDKGEWLFNIFDALGRIVLKGTCKNNINYLADPLTNITVGAVWTGLDTPYKGYSINGIVLAGTVQILTANYYDNYNFLLLASSSALSYVTPTSGYGSRYAEEHKGKLTGTYVGGFSGTSINYSSAMYYDDRERLIQIQSTNHFGGKDSEFIGYNFIGQPLKRMLIHSAPGKTTQNEYYTYTYDHAGRLLTTVYKLNSGSEILLANNEYDELGRLKSNKRNGCINLKSNYTYNVRSLVKTIANPLFSQTLFYQDNYAGNIPCYNGNISAMNWTTYNDKNRGYTFNYNSISQLTKASYFEAGINSTNYSTEYAYDNHGNITSLIRNGKTDTKTFGPIDKLSLMYQGNQLKKVTDAISSPILSDSGDFKDGTNQEIEYRFDKNGNMIQDLNKGISKISYNLLNLPVELVISNSKGTATNTYIYAADGRKINLTMQSGGSNIMKIDYIGNMIYENGILKRILIDGGYIENGTYYFYLQDHLGSNRVIAKADGSVAQTNHYYPFGMTFAEGVQLSNQPYKYNSKELDSERGLNLYDYSARQMDATLGRFTTIDPLSEKYYSVSPYAYCLNNPIKFIDPTGKLASPIYNEKGKLLGTDDEGLKGEAIIMNETDFKQGMSHEKALSQSLGYDGLVNDEARSSYVTSYTGLKDRPDYDGYLTLEEANKWYKYGNGQPLFTTLEKIDLSGIYSLGEEYVGQIKSFNLLLHSGCLNDGLVYGNITLKRYPNHSVRAFSDKYDFEMHNSKNPFNWGRNAETIIGKKVAGEGQSFEINIYGSKKLVPFLPWIK